MDRYERPLLVYTRRLLNNSNHAADVFHEAFLKLCGQSPGALNGSLLPWLYTVCRSRAMDIKRKEKRMTLILAETVDRTAESTISPAEQAERSDSTSQIIRLMANLPPNQQETLRLKFQHRMSYRKISCITGLTETNIGFLISTGLKTIRERLRERGEL